MQHVPTIHPAAPHQPGDHHGQDLRLSNELLPFASLAQEGGHCLAHGGPEGFHGVVFRVDHHRAIGSVSWCSGKLNVAFLYIAKNFVSGFDLHVYFILFQVLNYLTFIQYLALNYIPIRPS